MNKKNNKMPCTAEKVFNILFDARRHKEKLYKIYLRPQDVVFLIDLDQIKPGYIHADGTRRYDKELSHY